MPEIEVTIDMARSIREWGNKNGRHLVSRPIDEIGSINIVDGDPLLVINTGFKNVEGKATEVCQLLTSGEVIARLVNDGVIEMPMDENLQASLDELRSTLAGTD